MRAALERRGKVIESTLLILVIVSLAAYLIYALLRPEKF
jgi:K+-transporting ATPase KdpF subunit